MPSKKRRAVNGDTTRIARFEREQKRTNAHLARLETVQRDANARLARIEDTLEVSSRLFELMHARLEGLEEGQKAVIERLDRLVAASTRERTGLLERMTRLERRVERSLGSR